MKAGDVVRLTNLFDVYMTARKIATANSVSPEFLTVPNVYIGEVGRVLHDPGSDGLFEVFFGHVRVLCSETMVELVSQQASKATPTAERTCSQ